MSTATPSSLKRISAAFHNELIKACALKYTWLGLALSAAMPFFCAIGFKQMGAEKNLNGVSFLSNSTQLAVTSLIPLFVLVHAALQVVSETAQGTYRDVLSRPLGRPEFLFSKLLAAALFPLALLAVNIISGLIIANWKYQLGAVMDGETVLVSRSAVAAAIAIAALLTMLPLIALLSFGFFVSTIARTYAGAFGFTLGIYIGMEPFKFLIPVGSDHLDKYVFSSYLDTGFGMLNELASGISISWNSPDVLRCIITSAIYTTVFLLSAFIIFQKRDLNK